MGLSVFKTPYNPPMTGGYDYNFHKQYKWKALP